jgi:ubiquinone/menaquinone biosynthesis C-methylase UbiE
MNLDKHKLLFNIISPGYNWFFNSQSKNYAKAVSKYFDRLSIPQGGRILDVGCGTGALTHVLAENGYAVTGVDIARLMMRYGIKRGLDCRYGNIVEGLDFENNSFDLVTFAYVAHGMDREKRRKLFLEASRLSRRKVLFHDYSQQRSRVVDVIEYIEGGDYFNFIRTGLSEMQDVFKSVEVLSIKKQTNWYICTPRESE